MAKSRKGYIMGSKLHKMAMCKSPLKQTVMLPDPGQGDVLDKKVDIKRDIKKVARGGVKQGAKYGVSKGVEASLPTVAGYTGLGTTGTTILSGGIVPALATYGAIKAIGGTANYLDKHGTQVEAFKDNISWQDRSRAAGGPDIKSKIPDILKLDSDPTKKKR